MPPKPPTTPPEGLSIRSEGVRILNPKMIFSDFSYFFRFFRFFQIFWFFQISYDSRDFWGIFLRFLGSFYDFRDFSWFFVIFWIFFKFFKTYSCEKRGKYRILLLNIHFKNSNIGSKIILIIKKNKSKKIKYSTERIIKSSLVE